MIIVLPLKGRGTCNYIIDTDNRIGGKLLIKYSYSSIKNKIPEKTSEKLLYLKDYISIDTHKYVLKGGKQKYGFIPCKKFRFLILELFKNEIQKEPKYYKPKEVWDKLRKVCWWVRGCWVVTNKRVYLCGYEPDNLYINKILITGQVLLVIT